MLMEHMSADFSVNEPRTADLSIVKQLIRSFPKHPNFLQVTDSQEIKLPIESGNENSLLMKVVYRKICLIFLGRLNALSTS
jgi:hypothetical protein